VAEDDEQECGVSYDHSFPEPEFIDGTAVLVCNECGGEIFIDEESTDG
jgi:hypothetical protein